MNSTTNLQIPKKLYKKNQETFLQKLLGQNYKWFFVIIYNIKFANSGILATFVMGFSQILETLTTTYLWSMTGANSAVFTYLLLGRIYRTICENNFYNALSDYINSGKITTDLMIPSPLLTYWIFKMIGRRLVRNFVNISFYILACFIAIFLFAKVDFNLEKLPILVLMLPISYLIQHFIGNCLGLLAFFVDNKRNWYAVLGTWESLRTVLIGSIIPLDKLPFSGIFQFLPTSFWLHHPMQIYLGKYSTIQILYVFLGGIFWSVSLYFLAKFVFQMGLKRNESVGL
jgi:ABC-type uncharacterized transport system permease subunit